MDVDRNAPQVLDREECLRLLGTATLGRVALSSGALPSVVPVVFCLDGDRVVIRTRPGGKLDAAIRDAVVAFQVDAFDPTGQGGWSVEVTGVARQVPDGMEPDWPGLLPVRPSAETGTCLVAISTELVAGQRFVPGALGEAA